MNKLTSHLRVSVLPVPVNPADAEANLLFVREAMEHLPAGADILVLPELFTTGFHPKMDLARLADAPDGKTMDSIRDMSRRYGVAIAGSFLCADGGLFYNRAFFVEPSGDKVFYDKHHLFSSSAEGTIITSGTKLPPIVRFRGWNISIVTCYDLRFPGWCRNRNATYDLLLIPANWPVERGYAWKHLLIARAIENQSAVVGANRGGEDKFGHYDDNTFIIDCLGQPVGEKIGQFIVADLDKSIQMRYREEFPALEEWDSSLFKI